MENTNERTSESRKISCERTIRRGRGGLQKKLDGGMEVIREEQGTSVPKIKARLRASAGKKERGKSQWKNPSMEGGRRRRKR